MSKPRPLLTWWIAAALLQLAGDVGLYLAAGTIRRPFAWLDVRITRPMPDSLRLAVSRYLRDSVGVSTARQGDTLVVTLPPAARQSIDAKIDYGRRAGRQAAGWLLGALLLLHAPLLIAIGVTIFWVWDRARDERNQALDEWRDPE